ncbi:hypothetical protein HN385_01470 [archaeon]|mgnify:CR=1 FL=1|jgi:hypothetical protein|nr:hypothetical protein [archaeon]MBT3451319.1 hypothetical protein [archaeon]MBT6869365.1 hypothetical protein [archaeon]MBT7192528.1 hypothetical protein [archaeon]MBT7380604.1 hypothetical protein [archaeon]
MTKSIEDLVQGKLMKEKSLPEGKLQIRNYLSEITKPGKILYNMHYLGHNFSICFSSAFHEHLTKEDYEKLFQTIDSYETFRDLSCRYNERKTEEYWAKRLGAT